MSETPHPMNEIQCTAVNPHELPGHTANRIAKALLMVNDEAHRAYHEDASFRVTINSLAATLVPVVEDMAIAAHVRLAGFQHALKAHEQATHPILKEKP